MIPAPTTAQVVALLAALGLHGMLLAGLPPGPAVEIAGASGASSVQLGSSFADLQAGQIAPAPAEPRPAPAALPDARMDATTAPPEPQPVATPSAARSAPTSEIREQSFAPTPASQQVFERQAARTQQTLQRAGVPPRPAPTQATHAATHVAVQRPDSAPISATPGAQGHSSPLAAPDASKGAARLERVAPAPAADAQSDPASTVQHAPPAAARPAPIQPARADTAPRHLTGAEVRTVTSLTTSPRPQPRADRPATVPPPRTQAERAALPAATGNADRTASAGAATGEITASARSSGTGGTSSASGNAAVTNYPGLVRKHLSRAPHPRLRARGAAVIRFGLDVSGRVVAAQVARSSGSAPLDAAALRMVRSASPFPAPPKGAQRSFTIQIKGR